MSLKAEPPNEMEALVPADPRDCGSSLLEVDESEFMTEVIRFDKQGQIMAQA